MHEIDIQILDGEGTWLGTIGERGEGEGQFRVPEGIAVDMAGDLWVADFSNNRIQRFGPTGEFLDAWGRSGSADGQLKSSQRCRRGFARATSTWPTRTTTGSRSLRRTAGSWARMGGSGYKEPGKFTFAIGVAVAENGVIFVSDANRVQAFRLILPAGDSRMPGRSMTGRPPGRCRVALAPSTNRVTGPLGAEPVTRGDIR